MTEQESLVNFLIEELGSSESVKRFSENLRQLSLFDLRDIKDVRDVTKDEGAYLLSLVTYHQMGILDRLVYIKTKSKE